MNSCLTWFNKAAFVIYVVVWVYAVINAIAYPFYNWDMIAYTGAALSWKTSDPQIIYNLTVEHARLALPGSVFHQYLETRHAVRSAGLALQLPFYTIKPLYIAAMWLFYALGAGLASATWLVSAAAYATLGIILAMWRPAMANYGTWLLSVILFAMVGFMPMNWLPHYSTPDALAIALIMLGIISQLHNRSVIIYGAASILAVLTRPDMLLLVTTLTLYFHFFAPAPQKLNPVSAFVIILSAALSYIIVGKICGAYSWETLFIHTFIGHLRDPIHTDIHLTWEQYSDTLVSALKWQFTSGRAVVFGVASLAAAAFHYRYPASQRHFLWLLALLWVSLAIRFALFPASEDERHYYAYYLLMLMAVLELMAPAADVLKEKLQRFIGFRQS